jgi:cytochrome P450
VSVVEACEKSAESAPVVPPYTKPLPADMGFLARMAAVRKNPIAGWGPEAYREDYVAFRLRGRGAFAFNTPDAIQHVLIHNQENYLRTPGTRRMLLPILGDGLLLAEGAAWKLQRRTLSPGFTPRAVTQLVPLFVSVIDEAIAKCEGLCGRAIDLHGEMARMTLNIVGRAMFSLDLDKRGSAVRELIAEYCSRVSRPSFLELVLPFNWPTPQAVVRARFRRKWARFIRELIAERRATVTDEGEPRDLFDLIVSARDPETGQGFSDAEITDQVATLVVAGHDTTALTLFWALYLLALDRAAQETLASEVHELTKNDEFDIGRLIFTRAVLDETMRLFPPTFTMVRVAAGPDEVSGVQIAQNDIVYIAPGLIHRHEKLWQNPNAFMPTRFMPPAVPPGRFSFLPFGVGPRVCIGANFALVESTLALAKIVGTFRVELVSRQPVMPIANVTTQPDHSPSFRIERRRP